jgi:hypothetical protein
MKVYDTKVIQHVIPIKEDHKPFKKKLRIINPLLLPLIEKEIKKLFESKIIVSLRFSKWLENMVPIIKKSGEIRLCVDFRNLNRVSLKDKYPLPKMGHILRKIQCWMVSLGVIRSWCTLMIRKRQHSQHHRVSSCMPRFILGS